MLPRISNAYLLWVAALALLLWHHFFAYFGHYGFDDMHYAQWAAAWSRNGFSVTDDHYTFRWGLLWPLSAVYSLFGINDHSSALVALLAALSVVWVLTKVTTTLPAHAQWIAVFACLTCEWVLFYSDKIMPDILVMAGATWAFYAVYKAYFFPEKSALNLALQFNLALWFAFLAKETIVFVLPAFGVLLLTFRSQWTQIRPFAGYAALVFAGCLLLYAGVVYGLTGEVGSRFKAIALNSYFNTCSYDQLPIEHLYRRIGYEFWRMLLGTGIAVFFPLLFIRPRSEQARFWWVLSMALLLLGNFMSTSYRSYVPLCLDIRHYLFVVPVLSLMGAFALAHVANWQVSEWAFTLLLAIVLTVAAYFFEPAIWKMHAGQCIALLTLAVMKHFKPSRWSSRLLVLLLVVFFAYTPYRLYRNAQSSNYTEKRALVYEHLYNTPDTLLVVTNAAERNMGCYLLGFDTTRVQWLSFAEADSLRRASADSILLLMNGFTEYQSNHNWDKLPLWVRQPAAPRKVLLKGRGIELQVER
jgi:hypothetical protein